MTDAISIISSYSWRTVGRDATADDTFRDLRLDCIDRTCIAMEIEEAFECDLPDAEVERWASVADVAATIEALAKSNERREKEFAP